MSKVIWSWNIVYKVVVQLHSKLINLSVGNVCMVQVGLQRYRSVFTQTYEWIRWMVDQSLLHCGMVQCLEKRFCFSKLQRFGIVSSENK